MKRPREQLRPAASIAYLIEAVRHTGAFVDLLHRFSFGAVPMVARRAGTA
jgi:hypothetical protein